MKKKISIVLTIILQVIYLQEVSGQTVQYPPIKSIAHEPLVYTGKRQPDKRFYDGGLPHAVGVHSFQVFRANRIYPANPGPKGLGWTYNHQPYLAYWNGQFYLQYLSDPFQEHGPPGRTNIITSKDGRHWSRPFVVFPPYTLPKIDTKKKQIPAGTKAVMHQRMGFYVAPNGRLLTSGFYGLGTRIYAPNSGDGVGRVVREIYKDGSLGPIYFILYNKYAGFNESNTSYPYYTESDNPGFKAACDSLLSDPLMRLQWWEEQRGLKNFFPIDPSKGGSGKAFDFFHRADGVVVGMWKGSHAALSSDEGKTWTPIAKDTTMWTVNAKVWGQRLSNGRYALVYDHSATHDNRWPLVAITSDDAHSYKNMLIIQGQVPPMRYQGVYKNTGPQYVRGIIEGNGNPPGKDLWVTYSMNKEDIWVSDVRVPITDAVSQSADQSFDKANELSDLALWNFYVPRWAPTSIKKQQGNISNHYLQLKDEDPYDYARAERIFPKSGKATIQFKVNPQKVTRGHALEINVSDQRGNRALRLRFDRHWLSFALKGAHTPDPLPLRTGHWYKVRLTINCDRQSYDINFDGTTVKDIPFGSKVDNVERVIFRTGPYRNYVPSSLIKGAPRIPGVTSEDRPGAGEKVPACIYWIDDVKTSS